MTGARKRSFSRRSLRFGVVAYAFWIAMAGTTLPTPLYPLYEQRFGFSALTVTVVFATYAVGVIAALLVLGGLSDVFGRRPVLAAGLLLSAASAVLFLVAKGLAVMLAARMLSGLSAGLFTGSATAALGDIAGPQRRPLASGVATAANLGGLGCGTLLAGLLAASAVLPLRLPFWADLALLVPALAGVAAMREPLRRRGDASFRIRGLHVPREVRPTFVPAAVAGFASFAMSGLFSAVAPSFLATDTGLSSTAVAGAIVFALFAASAVGQLAVSRIPAALAAGCAAVLAGAALVAAALALGSVPLMAAGAVIAGLGQGFSVGGGIDALNARAPAGRRGEVASTFFVVLYLALSIPIVGVGLATQVVGLRSAGLAFTALVAALTLACLVILLARSKGRPGTSAGSHGQGPGRQRGKDTTTAGLRRCR